MPRIAYLDFDLLLQREGEGFRARVPNSPAGQASHAFELPFNQLEIENLLLKIGRPRHTVRRLDAPESAAVASFGTRLFEAVFGGEVRGCFRSSVDEAARQDRGLRVRLHLAEAPELGDLPWEYLCNPSLKRFLSLSHQTPVVRYLDLSEAIRPLAVTPPFRVLVMIASPEDYPRLDVGAEWEHLNDTLSDLRRKRLVEVERLEGANLPALQQRLRQAEYNVFHFIGHGGFDRQTEAGVLVLEDRAKRGQLVSGDSLGTLLHNHRSLRLAILNACEGGRASAADPFAGIAQNLVRQGIPAVIAMQFEITDQAAIAFAHEFYMALAAGYPVDAAVTEARVAISVQGNNIEWGTPVVYMRCPDGVLFSLAHRPSTGDRRSASGAETAKAERADQVRPVAARHKVVKVPARKTSPAPKTSPGPKTSPAPEPPAQESAVAPIGSAEPKLIRPLIALGTDLHGPSIAPDGGMLAAGVSRHVCLWNLADGQEQGELAAHTDTVNGVAFSPDGSQLASASSDKSVLLWSLSGGAVAGQPRKLATHPNWIACLAFSPGGSLLVFGTSIILSNGAVALVRIADGELAQNMNEHLWSLRDVSFSPSRPLLASWSSDKTVLWGVEDGGPRPTLAPLQRLGGASCGAFSPDGRLLALGSETEISLVSGWDGKLVQKLALKPTGEPVSAAFSADGRILAAGGRELGLWDVASGRQLASLGERPSYAKLLRFNSDGTLLTAISNGAVWRWRLV